MSHSSVQTCNFFTLLQTFQLFHVVSRHHSIKEISCSSSTFPKIEMSEAPLKKNYPCSSNQRPNLLIPPKKTCICLTTLQNVLISRSPQQLILSLFSSNIEFKSDFKIEFKKDANKKHTNHELKNGFNNDFKNDFQLHPLADGFSYVAQPISARFIFG